MLRTYETIRFHDGDCPNVVLTWESVAPEQLRLTYRPMLEEVEVVAVWENESDNRLAAKQCAIIFFDAEKSR